MAAAVLLIHGAWLTPSAWTRFAERYAARGVSVLAPAWPGLDGAPQALRDTPPRGLAGLTLEAVVDAFAGHAARLDAPPLLIGHGLGGLVVQRLLDRGLGACGVAIATTPSASLSARTRAAWALGGVSALWRGGEGLARLSPERFASLFAQGLPEAERRRAYAEHVVPASARLVRQALGGAGLARVSHRRPPLLLIAGDEDRVAPPAAVRAVARRQQRGATRTDLQCFAGQTHWLCLEPGWEAVADFALDWALVHGRVGRQPPKE